MVDEDASSVLERLITALAAQVGTTVTPALTAGAVEALSGLSRTEADLIFTHAGHLVHYGTEPESLQVLIRLMSDVQRGEAAANAAILPGDEVRLVGELPTRLAEYDANWLRETVFVVRYVGDDGTVDVQPTLTEDYVIETVPTTNLKSTR